MPARNFEIIAQKYPSGGDPSDTERLIFIDVNGDQSLFSITVSPGDGTYPSSPASIVAGTPVKTTSSANVPGGPNTAIQFNNNGVFGGVAGATSNGTSITFTAGNLISPTLQPAADSVTAIQIENAAGSASIVVVDTTNLRVGINTTPTSEFHVVGIQPASVGTTPGTTADEVMRTTGGTGGTTTIATTGTGGGGANFKNNTGIGGIASAAATSATGGLGGSFEVNTGGGGAGGASSVAGTGTNRGGNGGVLSLNSGAGGTANGNSSGTNTGGNSGAVTLKSAAGGDATTGSGTLAGGASGSVTIGSGNGGAGTSAGASGVVTITTGNSGAGTANTAGQLFLNTGAGGTAISTSGANTAGNGGPMSIAAGNGGAASGAGGGVNSGGSGASITITPGTGGAATNGGTNNGGAGGNLTLNGGIGGTGASAAGAGGDIIFQTTPTTGALVEAMRISHTASGVSFVGQFTKYNNVTLAGAGVSPIVGFTSQKAETAAADANVLTVTPPAAVGTYRVTVAISVSSATAGVISWTLSYTDSNGNAQTNVAQQIFQQGTAAPNTTFTTSAAGNYYGSAVIDINNGAANIVVKWVGGGTAVAKMSASIERLN